MTYTLRDYQEACVQAHYDFFAENDEGHPLFVVPTGGGKSLIIAEFIRRTLAAWPETRILIVTHVRELIEQNCAEFIRHWGSPDHPAGIYSAGLGARQHTAHVLFAGIQSIYDKAKVIGHVDLVLVDEAHLIPKKGFGRYRRYLMDLAEINMQVKVCGYTATPYRLDGGYLHKTSKRDEYRIFTDVAYEVPVIDLIDGGYLTTLRAKDPDHKISTAGVRTTAGEFNAHDLEQASFGTVELAVAETVELARKHDRKHWLIFGTGIRHAERILEELAAHDVDARAVFGHTPKDERDETVQSFRDGRLTALVNVGVLTTGFNAPCIDLMAVMRPTKSTALYVQMMGRGMRTSPGKTDCLVLDFGGNVLRHGPINDVKPRKPGDPTGVVPMKRCPECKELVLIAVKECEACGYVFPMPKPIHEQTAGTAPLIERTDKPRRMVVNDMHVRRHTKADRPDSMRVDYRCGMLIFSEWVCFEHGGFAREKAAQWWTRMAGTMVPQTVGEALDRQTELRVPEAVWVRRSGKYDSVTRVEMKQEQEA